MPGSSRRHPHHLLRTSRRNVSKPKVISLSPHLQLTFRRRLVSWTIQVEVIVPVCKCAGCALLNFQQYYYRCLRCTKCACSEEDYQRQKQNRTSQGMLWAESFDMLDFDSEVCMCRRRYYLCFWDVLSILKEQPSSTAMLELQEKWFFFFQKERMKAQLNPIAAMLTITGTVQLLPSNYGESYHY